MNILVVHASKDTDKPDASAAFIPESINFTKHRESLGDVVQNIGFDNSLSQTKRFQEFLKLIDGANNFDAFVYIGHGLRTGLPSCGTTMSNRKQLTDLLFKKSKSKTKLFVTLFACSAAETMTKQLDGEGGMADKIRDDLVALGMTGAWCDAHPVPGHTTQNSLVKRFYINNEQKDHGAQYLIAPGSPEFSVWRKKLNSKWRDDPFRFDFPYMSSTEIHTELAKKG